MTALLGSLGVLRWNHESAGAALRDRLLDFDPMPRLQRQFDQVVGHTQALIRASEKNHTAFGSAAGSRGQFTRSNLCSVSVTGVPGWRRTLRGGNRTSHRKQAEKMGEHLPSIIEGGVSPRGAT